MRAACLRSHTLQESMEDLRRDVPRHQMADNAARATGRRCNPTSAGGRKLVRLGFEFGLFRFIDADAEGLRSMCGWCVAASRCSLRHHIQSLSLCEPACEWAPSLFDTLDCEMTDLNSLYTTVDGSIRSALRSISGSGSCSETSSNCSVPSNMSWMIPSYFNRKRHDDGTIS